MGIVVDIHTSTHSRLPFLMTLLAMGLGCAQGAEISPDEIVILALDPLGGDASTDAATASSGSAPPAPAAVGVAAPAGEEAPAPAEPAAAPGEEEAAALPAEPPAEPPDPPSAAQESPPPPSTPDAAAPLLPAAPAEPDLDAGVSSDAAALDGGASEG